MYSKISINHLVLSLNWLFIFFPLSFIAGNLIVNLNCLLFICLGLIYLAKNNFKFKYNFIDILLFCFCIVLIISSIINQSNIHKSFFYLRFFVFYYICYYLFKEKIFDIKKVFYFYAIFVFIISADLIIQYFLGYNIIGLKINELGPTSFFYQEKIAGSFVQQFGFFLIFVIFSNFTKNTFLHKFLISILISIISISIYVSFQRMPMMVWMLFLIIYGLIYYKTKLTTILFSIVLLSIFIVNFSSKEIIVKYNSFFLNVKIVGIKTLKNYSILTDEKLFKEMKKDKITIRRFEGGSGHASLFASALYMWGESKTFGIGYKNFYNKCAEKKLTRCTTHPHNYYLDVLVTTGLIGLLILLLFLTIIFLKIINLLISNPKNKEILSIASINFLMYFFPFKSSGSFFTTANSTYMVIILVILISQLQKENMSINKN